MSCVYQYAICVIRSTSFSLDVGLSGSWADIVADPSDWSSSLVMRAVQSDLSPALLTLSVTPEVMVDPLPGEPVAYLRFAATPAETAALPAYDLAHYVDLTQISTGQVRRLFEGKVEISD